MEAVFLLLEGRIIYLMGEIGGGDSRVPIPPVTIRKSFNWFVGLKQTEVKRRNTAQMWPRSKRWMRVHKRTFNTPRLKSHLSSISSLDFVC